MRCVRYQKPNVDQLELPASDEVWRTKGDDGDD